MSKALDYLSKELKDQSKELDLALKNGMNPLAHACSMDMVRFFKKRIEVAKLIEKEDRA